MIRLAGSRPARFLLVGAAGYGLTLLAFAGLDRSGAPYAAASVLAYLLANAFMYVANRYFTFRLGNAGFWRGYLRYVLVGLLVAALTAAVLALLVELAGVPPTPGQALALLAVTPVAFVLIRRWTFQLAR